MTELKPCPFCGADGMIVKLESQKGKYCRRLPYKVQCSKCKCAFTYEYFKTEEDAAEIWNRRANNG